MHQLLISLILMFCLVSIVGSQPLLDFNAPENADEDLRTIEACEKKLFSVKEIHFGICELLKQEGFRRELMKEAGDARIDCFNSYLLKEKLDVEAMDLWILFHNPSEKMTKALFNPVFSDRFIARLLILNLFFSQDGSEPFFKASPEKLNEWASSPALKHYRDPEFCQRIAAFASSLQYSFSRVLKAITRDFINYNAEGASVYSRIIGIGAPEYRQIRNFCSFILANSNDESFNKFMSFLPVEYWNAVIDFLEFMESSGLTQKGQRAVSLEQETARMIKRYISYLEGFTPEDDAAFSDDFFK